MISTGAGIGSIVLGLVMVLALALVIYALGAWVVGNFRRGRIEDETDISYPTNTTHPDDRRAQAEVQRRDQHALRADNATDAQLHGQAAATPAADTATDETLREQAVGARRPVRQSPARSERPADAFQEQGIAPKSEGQGQDTPTAPRTDTNPL